MIIKKALPFITAVCVIQCGISSGAIPKTINYQAKLTDDTGAPVTDGSYQMRFSIWDAETNGTNLWSEERKDETGTGGSDNRVQVTGSLYSILLGSIDPTANPLDLSFDQPYWLEVEIWNASASSYESFGRRPITSVGYAYMADMAENVPDGAITSIKIADNSITTAKIEDGAIINADISSSAAIADSKLAQITTTDKVAASAVEDKFLRNDQDDSTTGALTMTGLTVDTDTLHVDSANDRVGIGTVNPQYKLDIMGSLKVGLPAIIVQPQNPSFEQGALGESSPPGWTYAENEMDGYAGGYGAVSDSWFSEPDQNGRSYRLYWVLNPSVYEGKYVKISQSVDLTDVDSIRFDLKTGQLYLPHYYLSQWWYFDFACQVLINDTLLYERRGNSYENQTLADQAIYIPDYTGLNTLTFRLYSKQPAYSNSLHGTTFECFFDNIMFVGNNTLGDRFVVKGDGNVGIGTNEPTRKLHVSDVMRIEPRLTSPQSPSAGDIYFDGVTNKLRVFDGTAWRDCF